MGLKKLDFSKQAIITVQFSLKYISESQSTSLKRYIASQIQRLIAQKQFIICLAFKHLK